LPGTLSGIKDMHRETGKENRNTRRDDHLSEIYSKALDLFIENGYDGTSMSMIARVLGMSKANLYYYFPNKESLFYNIHVDFLKKHFIPILDEAERLPDPKDRIAHFLRKLTLLQASSKTGRVLFHENESLNKAHHVEITSIWRRAYELIRNAIRELQQTGNARHLRDSFLTFIALGMANWTVYWFDYGRQVNSEELAESIVETFFNGLLYPGRENH